MNLTALLAAMATAMSALSTVADQAVALLINPPVPAEDPTVAAAIQDATSTLGTITGNLSAAVAKATTVAGAASGSTGSSTGSTGSDVPALSLVDSGASSTDSSKVAMAGHVQ